MDKTVAAVYTLFSVEGFDEDDSSTYIEGYFRIRGKDNLAENLISLMEESDAIHRSNLAPFPIYCAMLCLMWNDFCEDRRKGIQKMQTFSEIFKEMISFLKQHYVSKVGGSLENQNMLDHMRDSGRAIQDISEIALSGLLKKNRSFPEEQFRECHDAVETCRRVGILTTERDVISGERRRDINISSLVASKVSFPHKLVQEYIAGIHIAYLFANDVAKYKDVKKTLLSRPEEFRYVFYFASALGNELGLDIIEDLVKCSNQYFCVDVALECHTEEAARAVGERWGKYNLTPSSSEHTVAGGVFMVRCNQVVSDIARISI
ncbi:uncharacterized protein [Diadema setosum]|uniref:uncharacterized protein n=1 Tax=Diadema setosum TaxID=31175 RepID=UPI003B3A5FA5